MTIPSAGAMFDIISGAALLDSLQYVQLEGSGTAATTHPMRHYLGGWLDNYHL